jgi:hypothetical protein
MGGYGQVGAASRFDRTPPPWGSPGAVRVRPATQGRNGRRALRRGASDRPVMSCQAGVGRTRPAAALR